jgi:hypothetical protein
MLIITRSVVYFFKKFGLLFTFLSLCLLFIACRMGDSQYMTSEQRQQLETAYDSLQSTYKLLMSRNKASADSMSSELQLLYTRMQRMR